MVKTIRTAQGPRHEIVARLGKLDGAQVQAARGWNDLDALLGGSSPSRQLLLTPEPASEPLWKEIDVRGVKVERLRQFGRVYLCGHLLERYRDWFGVGFEFLLYDVTSTYFEGLALRNAKAARGYSRDHRSDCKQVCIGLGVTPQGLLIAYEVFAGNRHDVTTLQEMVRLMEDKYGQAKRVWVLDRGIVSEENLEWLRQRGALYLVGTPRSQLKKHQAALLDQTHWKGVRPGVEVRCVEADQGHERFILCRSVDRGAKERAMLERQLNRLRTELGQLDKALGEHPAADLEAVGRKVGRWLGKYPAAAAVLSVETKRNVQGRICGLELKERTDRMQWAQLAHGAYLLRTNHPSDDPEAFWRWYIQLSQAEAAFRTGKSDLNLRPVFHQKTERVEAHILVSFLSLALWRTLEQWMRAKGLGDCARQLLLELDELRSMDVILPTRPAGEIRLRVVARPEKALAQLLAHLQLELPRTPKILKNAVPKTAT